MAGAGPLDAHLVAETLLDVAVAALDTLPDYDATLVGAPARQFVSPGLPAHDCEQVTVQMFSVAEAPTITMSTLDVGKRGVTGRVSYVLYHVEVVRCIPTSATRPPSAAALGVAAAQENADVWVLWEALHAARRDAVLTDRCSNVVIAAAQPLTPSGGFGGWRVPVEVQIEGYLYEVGS